MMLPNFAKLETKIAALEAWLSEHGQQIACTQEDVRALRRLLALQNGVAPREDPNDPRFQPRKLTRGPFALEETVTGVRLISEAEILEGLQGRYSADGFYANIGTNPFRVTVEFADGSLYARTVPAGTNYALVSFVRSVKVEALSGAAVYQLELR